jgi:hypothetical protein
MWTVWTEKEFLNVTIGDIYGYHWAEKDTMSNVGYSK